MSAAVAAAAAAALANRRNSTDTTTAIKNRSYTTNHHLPFPSTSPRHNRYEMAKQQDWNTFGQYLRNHHHQGQSPVSLQRCSGFHVLGFLKYLDQFGEIKVHISTCMFYGNNTHRPACSCPLKQAWTSLDATVSRLRAAFEEHGGSPETNPFGSPAVWLYLRETKECQAKARGLNYGG